MTSIIGIKTLDNSVVLASDSYGQNNDNEKVPINKLKYNKEGSLAIAMWGGFISDILEDHLNLILNTEVLDLYQDLSDGFFKPLMDLNLAMGISDNDEYNISSQLNFLVATQMKIEDDELIEEPGLYHIQQMGQTDEVEYLIDGTGSLYGGSFEEKLEKKVYSEKKAVTLALDYINHTTKKDLYSNGLDLLIVDTNGTRSYSDIIKKQEDNYWNNIKRKIKKSRRQELRL